MDRKAARENNRIGRWYTMVLLTLLLILIILLGVCVGVYRYRNQFTPEKWKRAPGRRAFIVSNFLDKYPPVGMSEEEVYALLGDPDLARTEEQHELGYVLGNVRTVLDAEWLMLELEDGVVTEYWISTGEE